jgi:hypothetical protein
MLLAATLSTSAIAGGKGKSGGGESQAGGLPALEDRVEADEALIAALQSAVRKLQTQVAGLQGQNNWAVVASDGTLARSPSSAGAVSVEKGATGKYEVSFARDVSDCAYEATIGDAANAIPTQRQISVSGDVDSDNPNEVFVQTFDQTGTTATDSPFHLYVSCP